MFIRCYFDEDVSAVVAAMLRARGYFVETTHEAKRIGNSDEQQLQFAVDSDLAFVTHNRADFDRIATAWVREHRKHMGIVIAVRRPARELANRLLKLLDSVTADEFENQLRYL